MFLSTNEVKMAANVQLVKDELNMITEINSISKEKKDLLKRTFCSGATDDELELFIHACDRSKLDPFMKQIHFVKYNGKVSIITGIDGYRLIAERTGRYMPGRETTFSYDKNNNLFSATSYVKKRASDGSWHECAASAILVEYKGTGPIWNNKPHVMIAKCSEALALRRAFPADLSGLYTEDEMDQMKKEEKPSLDISNCEKVDPYIPVSEEKTILFKDVLEMENIIESKITPYDKGYRERALKELGVESFSKLPESKLDRVRKNIAKKIADLTVQNTASGQ